MRFDRAVYDRLSDEDKAAYVQATQAAADTGPPPPEGIAPEKAHAQEGFEVIENDDGAATREG
ncbi:hypothetical protein [Jiangella alkaliphila]|uniref:Uncharacterized protein n=1 Tax=Jiangella alkaliphila TaxID=419479 RepID=A0A1H2M8G1_9ACTN|nr:hypothetical protein [Jiangella alkaliphila]SDU89459.1 hypothetical protein SAMN04488563_7199 [Jiangella alkaliphila]